MKLNNEFLKMVRNDFYHNYNKSRFVYDKKREIIWKSIVRYLQGYINLNSKVLDIGAGYCCFINNVKAKEKHALDIFRDLNKYSSKDVKTYNMSSTNMKDIKSNYFDVVFASNFFEHLKKEELILTIKEVKRVLRKNGTLIIIQPNYRYCYKEYFDDYTHETVFTDVSICDFLQNFGFKIEKCISRFLPFSMKSRLPKIDLLINFYMNLPYKPFAKQMLVIAKRNQNVEK